MRSLEIPESTFKEQALARAIDISGMVAHALHGHGFYHAAKFLGWLLPKDLTCNIRILDDTKFHIVMSDPYWNRLISNSYEYEVEIRNILTKLKPIDYWFLDLGSNFGYWSLIASSEQFGRKQTIAVEALAKTYRFLEKNRTMNGSRFVAMKKAISGIGGTQMIVRFSDKHASNVGASLINDKEVGLQHEVTESISIDNITEEYGLNGRPVVIKLDVEGMEVNALKGGTKTLQNCDALIIYEDHGSDKECASSKYLLDTGRSIFFVDSSDKVSCMDSLDSIRRIKVNKRKGYNFVAVARDSVFYRPIVNSAGVSSSGRLK